MGTWQIYGKAKKKIGNGTIALNAGVYKIQLHRTSASTTIKVLSTRSLNTSVAAEISATGGYAAGGKAISATGWTAGRSAKEFKFKYTTAGIIFTASSASLKNIRYALLRNSTGAGAGHCIAFCTLSTAAFSVTSPNTLTIAPHANGVFYLV